MEKIYQISLYISKQTVSKPLFDAVQSDTGRTIEATIYNDDGTTFSEAGVEAEFVCGKSDGTGTQHEATIEGSVVTVDLTAQDLACPGRTYAAIVLKKDGTILAAMPFYFCVVPIPFGVDVESTSDYQIMRQATEAAEEATEAATEAAEEAHQAAQAVAEGPQIINGHWYVWDTESEQYVDTGVNATGPQGPQGVQGVQGDRGEQGVPGERGETGPAGSQGPQGIQGERGETGPAGPAGSAGPAGPAGSDGADGRGIVSILKTGSSGLVDTYTITYTDSTTSSFTVNNGAAGQPGRDGSDGRGVVSILKTGTAGLIDTYTITYTDNTTSTFTVTNGAAGATGPAGPAGPAGSDGDDGRGIVSITKTGTAGLVDTYTILYSDQTTSTYTVTNGDTPVVTGKEDITNKVTSISSSSTDTQYPSAKCVYDIVGDVETLLNALL